MFCPQCGQQQVSDEMRFCSRCGFALGVVTELIAHDGVLDSQGAENRYSSRRQKAMRKSLVLFVTSFLLTIVLLGFTKVGAPLEVFAMIAALFSGIICFFGVFQFLAAYLKDDDAPDEKLTASSQGTTAKPGQLNAAASRAALPHAQGTPVADLRPTPQTAEMVRPPSVTENTTRLLDDETIAHRD
jgi:hypothetical protein